MHSDTADCQATRQVPSQSHVGEQHSLLGSQYGPGPGRVDLRLLVLLLSHNELETAECLLQVVG